MKKRKDYTKVYAIMAVVSICAGAFTLYTLLTDLKEEARHPTCVNTQPFK